VIKREREEEAHQKERGKNHINLGNMESTSPT
jgi:hypothetical protein